MAVRKPFEKDLYDKFDNPAKEALVKILEAKGHEIQNVSEDFYADVVSTFEGETYFSEAEVKRAWKSDWPTSWEEIRIPERKKRLIKKYNGNVTFYVFNHNTTQHSAGRLTGRNLLSVTSRRLSVRISEQVSCSTTTPTKTQLS